MQLFGHRGAAGEAPENTIAGVKHAISRGVRQVEIDLRLSADNQLIIVHDNNALRTAGVKKAIVVAPELSQRVAERHQLDHCCVVSQSPLCVSRATRLCRDTRLSMAAVLYQVPVLNR